MFCSFAGADDVATFTINKYDTLRLCDKTYNPDVLAQSTISAISAG